MVKIVTFGTYDKGQARLCDHDYEVVMLPQWPRPMVHRLRYVKAEGFSARVIEMLSGKEEYIAVKEVVGEREYGQAVFLFYKQLGHSDQVAEDLSREATSQVMEWPNG